MEPCRECGARHAPAERECPERPSQPKASEERNDPLKVDPELLQAAPKRPEGPAAPGEWGKVDDQPVDAVAPTTLATVTRLPTDRPPEPGLDHGEASGLELAQPDPPARDHGAGGQVLDLGAHRIRAKLEPAVGEREGEGEALAEAPVPRPSPVPPPLLASEALRKDLMPAQPGHTLGRALVICLGLLGAAATLLRSELHGLGVPVAGAFIGLSALGARGLSYGSRAAATVALSGPGMVLALWSGRQLLHAPQAIVISATTSVLAAALLFRSWHRGSLVARTLVATGMVAGATWLSMTGALQQLTTLETAWQGWVPAILNIPFALVLMLSLLAFMNARSTGGCGGWALILLLWFTAFCWTQLLGAIWPIGADTPALARAPADTSVAVFSLPLFASLFALGLAQLLASGLSPAADANDHAPH